ncbi:oligopeptide transporter [Mycena olivaceomarginata]|nr:oligopeptide transporter [Mycena olivaceomarginata]
MEFDFDAIEEEDSPLPRDDPDMPALTIRMWFVGLFLCTISSSLNVFFNFRSPAPSVVPLALLLIAYPFGKFLAYVLPITTYRFRSWEFSLNPGPWNIKEHVLVFIMANVAVGNPYGPQCHRRLGYWFALVLVLATQLTGFGLAGICRRFLNLVACTLLNTLHAEDDESTGGMTRLSLLRARRLGFLFLVLPPSSPGFLFEALSVFSFVCWAAPNNVPVNQLFGVSGGLGMSVLTFDWSQITWIGSPLMVPWTRSTRPAYADYSPLFLPATYAMTYLLAFALSTCVIVHTLLYHGRSLLNGVKKMRVESDDIHAKLMRNYPEVPDWWYALSFCVFFSLAIVAMEVWHTQVPVWALILAVMLPIIYILPSGFIYAMTGQEITLNILAQIIPGSLLPGNPLANMLFKSYSVQTLTEATSFIQDLKLGHYVKVPPRASFLVQLVGTLVAAFLQVGVKTWIFSNVEDICSPTQKSQLTCPHNQVFFTASIVWGTLYHPHTYALIVGALLPLPFWFWQRRNPNSWVKYISTPVILNGVSGIPPATGINYSAWFAVGALFQYFIRKRYFAWWSKFNYVTSAALDSGTVISLMTIFFHAAVPQEREDYG